MSVTDLILIVLVAAGAFYAGFQLGRFKALAERGAAPGAGQPLPGPLEGPLREAASAPPRPRGGPPPVAAGEDEWAAGRRAPPRRSTKPPPAAAGLVGTGTAEKPDTRQN